MNKTRRARKNGVNSEKRWEGGEEVERCSNESEIVRNGYINVQNKSRIAVLINPRSGKNFP